MINTQKAYILLSKQEGISLKKAKKMIDDGRVSVKNNRLEIARKPVPLDTRFHILESKCEVVFEDENLLVADKGVGVESYTLEARFNCKLINRLDRDTSGLILLAKNESTRIRAVSEFKARRVEKKYLALVSGKIFEEIIIDRAISTKKEGRAMSFVDTKGIGARFLESKTAITIITPLRLVGNSTVVEVDIKTGRTHQIRVHLASINHPIIGDIIYNKNSQNKNLKNTTKKSHENNIAPRMMLHCYKTRIFEREFISKIDIEKAFKIFI